MTKIQMLKHEVKVLTPAKLRAFRSWFLRFDANAWDNQIEKHAASGRLTGLAKDALAAHRRGKTRAL